MAKAKIKHGCKLDRKMQRKKKWKGEHNETTTHADK